MTDPASIRPVGVNGPAVVEVRGLIVRRAGRTILEPLDWSVQDGERWVVLGGGRAWARMAAEAPEDP